MAVNDVSETRATLKFKNRCLAKLKINPDKFDKLEELEVLK